MKKEHATEIALKNETHEEAARRHWQRPCTVECAVPNDWDDAKDKKYAVECIWFPPDGTSWHRHCMNYVGEQMTELHEWLDQVLRHFLSAASANESLLETMTALDKISAVRKLVPQHIEECQAEQQRRMIACSLPLKASEFLVRLEEALDQSEQALALHGRVLVHHALYGADIWLVELIRAGDWIGTALAELKDALSVRADKSE